MSTSQEPSVVSAAPPIPQAIWVSVNKIPAESDLLLFNLLPRRSTEMLKVGCTGTIKSKREVFGKSQPSSRLRERLVLTEALSFRLIDSFYSLLSASYRLYTMEGVSERGAQILRPFSHQREQLDGTKGAQR